MVSLCKRLVIIIAIVVSIAAISSSALIQKFGPTPSTIVIIVSTIIVPAIVINIMYWLRKYRIANTSDLPIFVRP